MASTQISNNEDEDYDEDESFSDDETWLVVDSLSTIPPPSALSKSRRSRGSRASKGQVIPKASISSHDSAIVIHSSSDNNIADGVLLDDSLTFSGCSNSVIVKEEQDNAGLDYTKTEVIQQISVDVCFRDDVIPTQPEESINLSTPKITDSEVISDITIPVVSFALNEDANEVMCSGGDSFGLNISSYDTGLTSDIKNDVFEPEYNYNTSDTPPICNDISDKSSINSVEYAEPSVLTSNNPLNELKLISNHSSENFNILNEPEMLTIDGINKNTYNISNNGDDNMLDSNDNEIKGLTVDFTNISESNVFDDYNSSVSYALYDNQKVSFNLHDYESFNDTMVHHIANQSEPSTPTLDSSDGGILKSFEESNQITNRKSVLVHSKSKLPAMKKQVSFSNIVQCVSISSEGERDVRSFTPRQRRPSAVALYGAILMTILLFCLLFVVGIAVLRRVYYFQLKYLQNDWLLKYVETFYQSSISFIYSLF